MQSFNHNIELMTPGQVGKDLIFNEAMLKLDGFCNHAIKGFVEEPPEEFTIGDKYIINQGQMKNSICYIFSQSSGWQFLQAKEGMVFFCQQLNQMILFDGKEWQKTQASSSAQQALKIEEQNKFIPISGEFMLNADASYLLLYMSENATLNLSNVKLDKLTLIIKQNYQNAFELNWLGKILWYQNTPHQLTQKANHFDVLEFYNMHETNHLIAKVICAGYQY
jgi:hypothetical protein